MKIFNSLLLICGLSVFSGCKSSSSHFTVFKDLNYTSSNSERQSGDLYLPKTGRAHSVALVIHGGGWTGRDRSDMASVSKQLAGLGIAAYNINYRLAPEHHYPAQLEDVHAALNYLELNKDRWSLNTRCTITVGYSAGAHLALLAAEIPGANTPEISGVIVGGSPVDLKLYPDSPFILKLMGGTLAEKPKLWQAASPINYVTQNHPPVFLFHGQFDQIVGLNNAEIMLSKLNSAGVPAELDLRLLKGHILVGFFQRSSIKKGVDFLNEKIDGGLISYAQIK